MNVLLLVLGLAVGLTVGTVLGYLVYKVKNGESSRLRPGRTRVRSSRTPTALPRRSAAKRSWKPKRLP